MGGTISSLQIAYSGLSAARLGIDVTGDNTANALTPGYVRQQVSTSPTAEPAQAGPTPSTAQSGSGVTVTGIGQQGSPLLDAQVRLADGAASASSARSQALAQIEATLAEPSATAVSGGLQSFWAAWQEVSNQPGDPAAASALIGQARALTDQIRTVYQGLQQQWAATYQDLAVGAQQLNADATGVAALNQSIRSATNAGGGAAALVVQRNNLLDQMASLAGVTVTYNADSTVDVHIGGTAIVQSTTVHQIAVAGATSMDGVEPPSDASPHLVWADLPGDAVASLDGGSLGGDISILGAQDAGGAIATTAHDLNTLATSLAGQVNAITVPAASATAPDGTAGTTGHAFFAVGSATAPAALTLQVVATGVSDIGVTGSGAAVGSAADQVSQIGAQPGSPDAAWSAAVVALGINAQTASQQSDLDGAAQTAAVNAQQSQESVDPDQESVNLVAYQQAYEANARVLSTMNTVLGDLMTLLQTN